MSHIWIPIPGYFSRGTAVTLGMKYRVSTPSVSLEDAIRGLVPTKRGTNLPSEHSLPNFHNNFLVRMLAAKPKMDILTRRHYPSTILNKVGITEKKCIGPVSRDAKIRGPRVWISASPTVTTTPIASPALIRRRVLPSPRINSEAYDPRSVLLHDIKTKLQRYLSATPENSSGEPVLICTVSTTSPKKTSSIPINVNIADMPDLIELDLPREIDNRKGGLHLAGDIYKYVYIYSNK